MNRKGPAKIGTLCTGCECTLHSPTKVCPPDRISTFKTFHHSLHLRTIDLLMSILDKVYHCDPLFTFSPLITKHRLQTKYTHSLINRTSECMSVFPPHPGRDIFFQLQILFVCNSFYNVVIIQKKKKITKFRCVLKLFISFNIPWKKLWVILYRVIQNCKAKFWELILDIQIRIFRTIF